MKKLLLSVAVLGFITLASSSCKKDYTCECTVNGDKLNIEINNAKSADAEASCSSAEATYKTGDPDAKCTLTAK